MANNVVNVFSVECAAAAVGAVEHEVGRLATELVVGIGLTDARTHWAPDGERGFRFVSAWGPDFDLQDHVTRRLAAIDPSVVVSNYYCEEFYQAVGVRLAGVSDGAITAIVEDTALEVTDDADSLDAPEEKIQTLCADAARGRWPDPALPHLVLVDAGLIFCFADLAAS